MSRHNSNNNGTLPPNGEEPQNAAPNAESPPTPPKNPPTVIALKRKNVKGIETTDVITYYKPKGSQVTEITIDTQDPERVKDLKFNGLIKGSSPTALAIGDLGDFVRYKNLEMWKRKKKLFADKNKPNEDEIKQVEDRLKQQGLSLLQEGANIAQQKNLFTADNYQTFLKVVNWLQKQNKTLKNAEINTTSLRMALDLMKEIESFEKYEREQVTPSNVDKQEKLRELLIIKIDKAINDNEARKTISGDNYSSTLHQALRKARDKIQRYEFQGTPFTIHDQMSYANSESLTEKDVVPKNFVYKSKDHSSHPNDLYRAIEMIYDIQEDTIQPYQELLMRSTLTFPKRIAHLSKQAGKMILNLGKSIFIDPFTTPIRYMSKEYNDFKITNINKKNYDEEIYKNQRPLNREEQHAFDELDNTSREMLIKIREEAKTTRELAVEHPYDPVRYDNIIAQIMGYAKKQIDDLESGAIANPGTATALGGVAAVTGLALFAPQVMSSIMLKFGFSEKASLAYIDNIRGLMGVTQKTSIPQKIDTMVQYAGLEAHLIHQLQKNTQALTDSEWEYMMKNPFAGLVSIIDNIGLASAAGASMAKSAGFDIGFVGALNAKAALNQKLTQHLGQQGSYAALSIHHHFSSAKVKKGLIASITTLPFQFLVPPFRLLVATYKAIRGTSLGDTFGERIKPEWTHFKSECKKGLLGILEFGLTGTGYLLKLIAMPLNVLFKAVTKITISAINITTKFLRYYNDSVDTFKFQGLESIVKGAEIVTKAILHAKQSFENFAGRINRKLARFSSKLRHKFRTTLDDDFRNAQIGTVESSFFTPDETPVRTTIQEPIKPQHINPLQADAPKAPNQNTTSVAPVAPVTPVAPVAPLAQEKQTPVDNVEININSVPRQKEVLDGKENIENVFININSPPSPNLSLKTTEKNTEVPKQKEKEVFFTRPTPRGSNKELEKNEHQMILLHDKHSLQSHLNCLKQNPRVTITSPENALSINFDLNSTLEKNGQTQSQTTNLEHLKNCYIKSVGPEATAYGIKEFDQNIENLKFLIDLMLDNIIKLRQDNAVVGLKIKGKVNESTVKMMFLNAIQERNRNSEFKNAGIKHLPSYEVYKTGQSLTPKP